LLFGGGPVGIELAGEIKSRYPEKGVALVHSHSSLVGGWFRPELGAKLLEKLEQKGVKVIFEEAVMPEDEDDPETTFLTDKGTTIEASLLRPHPLSGVMGFVCFGVKPNTAFLAGGPVTLDGAGRVRVDRYLRAEGHDDVFAIGDITDVEEPKTAYLAQKHAEVVAKNIGATEGGRKGSLKPYRPNQNPPMVVPVGPDDGVTQFPVAGGLVVGRRTTKLLKGRDLMVERYRKILGAR
jgi:NADH dehydrogenase FAD-containing subunit